MSCAVAPPGSPVFSPSRLLLPGPPDHHHHHSSSTTSFLPAYPLRFTALRARIRPDPSPFAQPPPAARPTPDSSCATAKAAPKRRRPVPLLGHIAVPAPPPIVLDAAAANGMDEVAEHGEDFAAFCRRGKGRKRVEMEDRHVPAVALGGDRAQALFGVFDGHRGKSAAEFAAENMPRIMAEELARGRRGAGVEEAVRRAYLRTDEEFSSSSADAEGPSGGACCVTALLREEDNGRRQLVVSSAGQTARS